MLSEHRRERGLWRRRGDIFDIEGLFETFLNDSIYPLIGGNMRVDIRENENEYILEAELPGVKREDINIEIRDNELSISVKKSEEMSLGDENYLRRERRMASASRTFPVENILEDKVTARFEDGILTIILPKKEPGKKKRRQIQIH